MGCNFDFGFGPDGVGEVSLWSRDFDICFVFGVGLGGRVGRAGRGRNYFDFDFSCGLVAARAMA